MPEKDSVLKSLESVLSDSEQNDLTLEKKEELRQITSKHTTVFCKIFYEGPPAAVQPLKIEMEKDARPVRVNLRNYSQE